jgi:alpha-N-arabinofuranosidase
MEPLCGNPILPGFYPDPSICRVGEDFYLVNSTFSYFPGVPIFHSKDLIHWEQIGNILNRPEQLNLTETEHSGGIYAPTIRYHNGLFYMITTNIPHGGNFIVTATEPAGPWSDPYYLADADGIDPSLFFDDDGRCYYTGTKGRRDGEKFFGDNEIYLQELDLTTMTLTGESYPIWHGALRDAEWAEGPHLYKKDGYYYLMIAEGGTGHNHAVTIARSKELKKPFTGHMGNPILTHRHLGKNYPIVNVGHGDLVETAKGDWWMVLLASRPYGGYYRNLGRETFLASVTWEEGWPVINYGAGVVKTTFSPPDLPEYRVSPLAIKEDFDTDELPLHFLFLRNPSKDYYSLSERKGFLRLKTAPETIDEKVSPAFACIRQTGLQFTATCSMEFIPKRNGEAAGMVILQNNTFYYASILTMEQQKTVLKLIKCQAGTKTELLSLPYDSKDIYLSIEAHGQNYSFFYSHDNTNYHTFYQNADGRILSTDLAGGFVGTCIGIYATAHGEPSDNYADFDWLSYENI